MRWQSQGGSWLPPPRSLRGSETAPAGALQSLTASIGPPGCAHEVTLSSSFPKANAMTLGDRSHRWALTHGDHSGHALFCPQSPGPGLPTEEAAVAVGFPSGFSLPCPALVDVTSMDRRPSVVRPAPSLQASDTSSLGLPLSKG